MSSSEHLCNTSEHEISSEYVSDYPKKMVLTSQSNSSSNTGLSSEMSDEKSLLYHAFNTSDEAYMAGAFTQNQFAREYLEQVHHDDLEGYQVEHAYAHHEGSKILQED